MPTSPPLLQLEGVTLVDGIARAMHRWIGRCGIPPASLRDPGQQAFLGGIIAGLCAALYPQRGAEPWVAYVYALMAGNAVDTVAYAQAILVAASDEHYVDDYRRGYSEGTSISAWFMPPRS